MSDSPPPKDIEAEAEGEKKLHAGASTDIENADQGVIVKANPLARQLKGRHMQMIAIGKSRRYLP